MWKTLAKDREYLENKYHKTNEPFDAFDRFNYHGYEFDPSTGFNDEEMQIGLEKLYSSTKDLPRPVAKARAVEYVLDHTRIDVNAHDYFIGIYSWGRIIKKTTIERWHRELFNEKIPETQAFIQKNRQAGTMTLGMDYEHSVPDWHSLFALGFRGILERAELYRKNHGVLTPVQEAYFDSINIEYTAILRFLNRLYEYALTRTHDKAKKIACCLKRLHDGKPQNTYDVLQMIYIYFMISESIECYQVRSLGNGLDAALYPYFINDLSNNIYSKEEIYEFIAYFLMQFSAIGNYWGQPFYLGGTNENGECLVNEVTFGIMDVYDQLGIYNPKVQIKVNYNTPQKFLEKLMDMIRRGHNSFVFLCEPGIVKSMMGMGLTYNEARTCDITGCYEFSVRAEESGTGPLYLNVLKPVILVFNNGMDRITGEIVGLQTGELENFRSFDDFYKAYIRQLEHILEGGIKAVNSFEIYQDVVNPSPMYSATLINSLQTMLDGYANGSKYNNTAILHTGFASAVDSLMAVKYLVYDKKITTLNELKKALENDWDGYAMLRLQAQKCPHKFGNNDPETDMYAAAISRWLCMKENMRPNARGGVYKSAMHSARHYLRFANVTEATPDGRKKGDELSKNISPVMGMDKQGVTALVHSAVKVDPSLFTTDFCLDVMLHTSATEGNDGLTAMNAVLRTYMENNGLAIHFNVFNAETLHDAQVHPEKYENLQVRVCGWNVLWKNLSRAEQDAYILRCENIA